MWGQPIVVATEPVVRAARGAPAATPEAYRRHAAPSVAVSAACPPTTPEKYLAERSENPPCPSGVGGWGVGKPAAGAHIPFNF